MTSPFREVGILSTSIRDLGLQIAGTALEPLLAQFQAELERAGITRLKPHFYLSTEWGVPFGSISIAIPFYLARTDLTAVHAERIGHLEGVGSADLLRYLRHEMGHVVNYAYRLYDDEQWVQEFGSMTQPYLDDYRPEPFSRRYVQHLPGWYAQKHPDEDWAETFAVWLTPQSNWRNTYSAWPLALQKLEFCERMMAAVNSRDPLVAVTDPDEDVNDLLGSLDDFYRAAATAGDDKLPPGLEGALQTIFEEFGVPEESSGAVPRRSAADLILRLEPDLVANIYRWTGHFPELTRPLVQHLATLSRQLNQVYPVDREATVILALTTLVTALAMNHVLKGTYMP